MARPSMDMTRPEIDLSQDPILLSRPGVLAYNPGRRAVMRKVLIVLILIAGAAYFIQQRSAVSSSEEVFQVKHLQARFSEALNRFSSAAGRAGTIGIDTTFDTETTVTEIENVRKELAGLRETLTEAAAIKRAAKLSEKIEYFCKQNNILRP